MAFSPRELDQFNIHLEEELTRIVDNAAHGPEPWTTAVTCARELVQAGGKRVRPKLFALSLLAAGGEELTKGIVKFAAGIELLHTCMLIHDDVMDRSEVRRGVPSVHCAIQNKGVSEERRIAEGVAIVVGDVLATLATEEFVAEELDLALARQAASVMHRAMRETAAGQILDLSSSAKPFEDVDEEDILLTYRLKTAFFAFEAPLRSGAILAGAPQTTCDALAEFGLHLGTAFQLRDDLIGFLGKPSLTGKHAVDDIREGKKTLIVRELWKRSNSAGRSLVESVLGHRNPDMDELSELRDLAISTGSIAEVEARIDALSQRAISELTSVELIEKWRDHLTLLVAWLKRREV